MSLIDQKCEKATRKAPTIQLPELRMTMYETLCVLVFNVQFHVFTGMSTGTRLLN